MFNARLLPVLLSAFEIREVSRSGDGPPQYLCRLKFEAEEPDPQILPFGRAAIKSVLNDSRGRAEDDGANTFKLRAKVPFSVGMYTVSTAGGDVDGRSRSIVEDAEMAITTNKDPDTAVRRLRDAVCGKARTVRFSGSTIGSPDANVVEGVLSFVWKVEARLSPDDVASLAAMLHSEHTLLDCLSEQTELDLFGDEEDETPPPKKGKAAAAGNPRNPRARKPLSELGSVQ